MGSYSYKDVMFRDDFIAAKPRWEAANTYPGHVCEYDGDAGYDGDGWRVAEFLLDEKDARIEQLEAALRECNLLTQTPHTHLVDAQGMRDLLERLRKIADASARVLLDAARNAVGEIK